MTADLERLTRRLAECPREFQGEPRLRGGKAGVHVAAVVSDLLEDLGEGVRLEESEAFPYEMARAEHRNLMRLTLVACWLCHDESLRVPGAADRVKRWLATGLRPLSELVAADLFVTDGDRREELVRLLLGALDAVPVGETEVQASDRLKAISSVERAKVVVEMRAQQERARKLREKLEAERAREAAARYSGE